MNHIIFLIAYIYFLYNDLRHKQIELVALMIYAGIALVTVAFTRENMTTHMLTDNLFSIAFGLVIYLLSYFSSEGIGMADGMYFVINGLLLPLRENLMLFLTGLFIAFVIGIFLFYFGNKTSRPAPRIPFFPCFLPAIIGYIICIV